MTKRTLYLAGPLFNPGEREQSVRLRSVLSHRFNVYLPHLDGALLPDLVSAGMTPALAREMIFADDVAQVRLCDVLMIVLNGRTIDEGAAFELGVAWALGKPCFGFKDDFRQLTASGDNPMIERALEKIFFSFDEVEDWLASA